jgi:hypothetical protein
LLLKDLADRDARESGSIGWDTFRNCGSADNVRPSFTTRHDNMGCNLRKAKPIERSKIRVEHTHGAVNGRRGLVSRNKFWASGSALGLWRNGLAMVFDITEPMGRTVTNSRQNQRAGPSLSTIFWSSKPTRNMEPSMLQINSTFFSLLGIVGSPEGAFLGKKKTTDLIRTPLGSRS